MNTDNARSADWVRAPEWMQDLTEAERSRLHRACLEAINQTYARIVPELTSVPKESRIEYAYDFPGGYLVLIFDGGIEKRFTFELSMHTLKGERPKLGVIDGGKA